MCVRISFLGDIAFVGNYNKLYKQGKHPFEGIRNELTNSDLVIGNLEAISEGNHGENHLKKPRLKLEIETLNYLKEINVGLVSLAHNHVYDNLKNGLESTIEFLDNNDIHHLGAGFSESEAKTPFLLKKEGITFGFLNYVTEDTNPRIPEDANVFTNFFSLEKAKEDIVKLIKESDFIIILLHWGGRVEGGCYPDWEQPQIAKELIQSGADLIIGHHSHTFQPYEDINNKTVFYSLGNFCFDDYYSDGKLKKLDTRKRLDSAIVHVDFNSRKKFSYKIKPIRNVFNKIVLNPIFEKKIKNRLFIFKYLKKYKLLWMIYYLYLKKIDPVLFFLSRGDITFKEKLKRIAKRII